MILKIYLFISRFSRGLWVPFPRLFTYYFLFSLTQNILFCLVVRFSHTLASLSPSPTLFSFIIVIVISIFFFFPPEKIVTCLLETDVSIYRFFIIIRKTVELLMIIFVFAFFKKSKFNYSLFSFFESQNLKHSAGILKTSVWSGKS